jgi:hypothetical protein
MATAWVSAIPPPPGVKPNIVDPKGQLDANTALHTICLTLVTSVVAIRLYTRIAITKASLGLDDCNVHKVFSILIFTDKTVYGSVLACVW